MSARAIRITRLRLTTPKIMDRLGQTFLRISRERVEAEGLGSSGAPMKPYSEEYQKRRAKAGRETDRRTLSFTGRMLTARLIKRAGEALVLVGFRTGAEQDKASGNEKRTPFVNPTPNERAFLAAEAKRFVKEQLAADQARARAEKE